MRKFLLGFIMGIIIMVPVSALGQTAYEKISAYVNPDIKVAVEGEHVDLDLAPIVYDQRTYLPVREIVEKVMGYEVNWNQETTTVEIAAPDIWPVKDGISINQKDEVDEVIPGSQVGPFGYSYDRLFFDPPENVTIEYVEERIRDIKGWMNTLNHAISIQEEASQNGVTVYPEHIIEMYRGELPKLQSRLEYWESLRKQLEEVKQQ
jgi:Copper amine oxidase N-terminal domain.